MRIDILSNRVTLRGHDRAMGLVRGIARLYFGRRIDYDASIVDSLACTQLHARRLICKNLCANRVTLRDHCRVETLTCDGPIDLDETCSVGEILRPASSLNERG